MTTEQRPHLVTPTSVSTEVNTTPPYGLDGREMEVLFLLREGLFVPQIAEELAMPQSAVEEHVGSLLTKMNARSKTEAAVIAIREGIFSRR
jgi:DNA-binding NarL/FixJ family response regulator